MICYYPDPLSLLSEASSPRAVTASLPDGGYAQLARISPGEYEVQSLYSPDPQAYLSGPFRPGQRVSAAVLSRLR